MKFSSLFCFCKNNIKDIYNSLSPVKMKVALSINSSQDCRLSAKNVSKNHKFAKVRANESIVYTHAI